jgi:hypothetical protein
MTALCFTVDCIAADDDLKITSIKIKLVIFLFTASIF